MPKHFLPLVNGHSLFEENYNYLLQRFKPSDICVQTTPGQVALVRRFAPAIPQNNIFVEPEMRNHGPATGFMATRLYARDPDEPFMVIQVDNLRLPPANYLGMIDECDKLVRRDHKLITGGFRPEYALMGVDYLVPAEKLGNTGTLTVYRMDHWLGRDSKEQTEDFLKNHLVFAHANHYCWTPRLMLDAFARHKPDWWQALQTILGSFGKRDEAKIIQEEYAKMTPGQVEEVTAHELANGYVVELPYQWIDFGTWESVEKFQKENDIYHPENLVEIDSSNTFVQAPQGKTVALIGVEDLEIIDSPDGLLVCHRSQSGRVGGVPKLLQTQKGKQA